MKNLRFRFRAFLFLSLAATPFFMGFDTADVSIEDTWVRKGDNLKIEIADDHAVTTICPGFASKVYSKARPRYES